MKQIIKITTFAILSIVFSLAVTAQSSLPNVEIKDLAGKSVDVTDLIKDNKVTIISFWATWCKPCQKELDAIAELYPDWQEDYDAQLIAISIDNARSLAKVKPMVTKKGWEYMILSDSSEKLKRALNFQTVPQTFVVDSEGNILSSHTGYVPGNEYELEEELAEFTK